MSYISESDRRRRAVNAIRPAAYVLVLLRPGAAERHVQQTRQETEFLDARSLSYLHTSAVFRHVHTAVTMADVIAS